CTRTRRSRSTRRAAPRPRPPTSTTTTARVESGIRTAARITVAVVEGSQSDQTLLYPHRRTFISTFWISQTVRLEVGDGGAGAELDQRKSAASLRMTAAYCSCPRDQFYAASNDALVINPTRAVR